MCSNVVERVGGRHLSHQKVWLSAVQDSGEGSMLVSPTASLDHSVCAVPELGSRKHGPVQSQPTLVLHCLR